MALCILKQRFLISEHYHSTKNDFVLTSWSVSSAVIECYFDIELLKPYHSVNGACNSYFSRWLVQVCQYAGTSRGQFQLVADVSTFKRGHHKYDVALILSLLPTRMLLLHPFRSTDKNILNRRPVVII